MPYVVGIQGWVAESEERKKKTEGERKEEGVKISSNFEKKKK